MRVCKMCVCIHQGHTEDTAHVYGECRRRSKMYDECRERNVACMRKCRERNVACVRNAEDAVACVRNAKEAIVGLGLEQPSSTASDRSGTGKLPTEEATVGLGLEQAQALASSPQRRLP